MEMGQLPTMLQDSSGKSVVEGKPTIMLVAQEVLLQLLGQVQKAIAMG